MNRVKKILSIILSVVMLVGCLAVSAFAVPADGKEVAYKLVTDKEWYNPGDTITFTLYVDVKDFSVAYGPASFYFSYDSAYLAPEVTNRQFVGDMIYKPNGAVTSSAAVHNGIKSALAETGEDALYNASFVIGGIWDTSSGVPSADGYKFTSADTPQITFQMKVSETAEVGTVGYLGMPQGALNVKSRGAYLMYPDGKTKVPADSFDLSQAIAYFNIGEPAPAGPTVEKSKAELKFTLTSATTVADDYLFRVTSKISDADWDAYFANTGTSDATTNAIQKLGFVAYKGTDGFSMDTAKAVAQGTPAEGYYNATTDYVQKVDDTSDAYFGAIIDTSKDTDSDATYVAYVQYLDAEGQTAYAFYADAQTALLEQNYDTYVQQYVTQFGSGFAA